MVEYILLKCPLPAHVGIALDMGANLRLCSQVCENTEGQQLLDRQIQAAADLVVAKAVGHHVPILMIFCIVTITAVILIRYEVKYWDYIVGFLYINFCL